MKGKDLVVDSEPAVKLPEETTFWNSYELTQWLIGEVTRHHGRLPVVLQNGDRLYRAEVVEIVSGLSMVVLGFRK